MAKVFKENIKGLSTELQKILVDDLVTAFQNRINVLNRKKTELESIKALYKEVENMPKRFGQ